MFDKIQENISIAELIKKLASILCVLEIIAFVIGGIAIIVDDGYMVETYVGYILIIAGSISAFLSNLVLYGFGIIVEYFENKNQ